MADDENTPQTDEPVAPEADPEGPIVQIPRKPKPELVDIQVEEFDPRQAVIKEVKESSSDKND